MLKTLYEEAAILGYIPRDVQIKAVEWLQKVWESPNKCKILASPVGSGKSLVAYSLAKYLEKEGKTCAIITPQNILIDQYLKEFPSLNYFKGKKHYPCSLTETTCEDGIEISRITKKSCPDCPYRQAKDRCYQDSISLFNPMSYFSLSKTKKVDGGFELLYTPDTIIIDEVQSLPSMLRDLLTIKIWETDIKWERGISSSIPNLIKLLEKYLIKISSYIVNKNLEIKEKAKLLQTQRRVDILVEQIRENNTYFVCEERMDDYRGQPKKCLLIRPKYVPPNISRQFFKFSSHVIFMTGTAFPHIWQELGFNKVDYLELPSPIPKENRRVLSTNSVSLSFQTEEDKKESLVKEVAAQIKHIVTILHPDESGVILAPYSLADGLKQYLEEPFFLHMDKKTKAKKIDHFLTKEKRMVGIFSGSFEGLSLNDDISRFTIIPKVPFPSLTDKVIQIRRSENEMSYLLEAMTMIIQGSGRSTRSETDHSTIYILDTNFLKVYSKTRSLLPTYFKESLDFNNIFKGNYENTKIN